MNLEGKIDIIFSKVSKIEKDVAVIMERDGNTEKRLNSHQGKLEAIDEVVNAYKVEKAKLMGIAVASGAIFAAIGTGVMWLVSLLYKNN